MNQYIIPFIGLKAGDHTFNFEVNKGFFEEYSELEINDGLIQIDVLLNKKSNFMSLSFKFNGWIELICDRCLEYFKYPLNYKGKLIVKFSETPAEPDDEVIFLSPNSDLLDLNQYIFDCIGLNIPIQRLHPADKNGKSACNEKMLDIIESHSVKVSENKQDETDPRWSKLKDLLKDGNKNN